MSCISWAPKPPSLSVVCSQYCRRAHLVDEKGLQELRIDKNPRWEWECQTQRRVKVCVCNVSVVHWITHASAPRLEIEGGENKMFKTYLDDFSGGCCINMITITSENKANSRKKKQAAWSLVNSFWVLRVRNHCTYHLKSDSQPYPSSPSALGLQWANFFWTTVSL